MSFIDLQATSNAEIWNALRQLEPNFASHTAEATAETFTEAGYGEIARSDIGVINEWVGLSVRVFFQKLRAARARNPLESAGVVETYDKPFGRFIQRITVDSVKPVSPAYKNIVNYGTVDPFVVKKATASEQFFGVNFDYQALLTVQDWQLKEIFLSPTGMGEYLSAVMQALDNAYMIQRYTNTLEVFNYILNNAATPLQDTQVYELGSWTAASPTDAEYLALIDLINDIASAMSLTPQSTAFNAGKFETIIDPANCVLLVRPGILNRIKTHLRVGAFNPGDLALPFEVREIEHFGGLVPYQTAAPTSRAYPVYDALGTEIGWATSEGAEEADLGADDVTFSDPNEKVLAVIAQKGVIFESIQNAYAIRTIYNPRGLYENYWASAANNSINYDSKYGFAAIKAPD